MCARLTTRSTNEYYAMQCYTFFNSVTTGITPLGLSRIYLRHLDTGNLVNQLGRGNLAALHDLEAIQDAIQSALPVGNGVRSDLELADESRGILAELDVELSVGGDGRDGLARHEFKGLRVKRGISLCSQGSEIPTYIAHERIRERRLGLDPLLLCNLLSLVADRQQHVVLSLALVAKRLQANLERFTLGDRIKTLCQLAARLFPDRLDRRLGIMVIHHIIRSKLLDELVVFRTRRRDNLVPGALGHLQRKQPDTGRSAVDQDPVLSVCLLRRVRQAETRVEDLSGRRESDTVDWSLVQRDLTLGGDLPCKIALHPQVLYSGQPKHSTPKAVDVPANDPLSVNFPPWTIPAI